MASVAGRFAAAGSATGSAVDASLRSAADRFVGTLLDAAPADRTAMLDALRDDDPTLHALVCSLTAHLDALDAFLETPPGALPAEDRGGAGLDPIGLRFGHWQVRRAIGRGGMGLVFEVERVDGVVRQRAALKLIKRRADDESIVSRFRTERQILAGLEHPNIARLIDAGASTEGRPYLVMEYVGGVPFDTWCDGAALTIDARIRLFLPICDAVQYAHQRLVIHRDLKPTNILVTHDGKPKLLDFGISKLVDAGRDADGAARAETTDASTLLTPRYASPEQLTGQPISTASDVYSLGVLLFEGLTGATPYPDADPSLLGMMRAVITGEPTRPSQAALRAAAFASSGAVEPTIAALGRRRAERLRGDLDHILMKTLARDPAERYGSAAALRDDLSRHLAGEPIEALAPSRRYRLRKFVGRHRLGVSLAATFAVAIGVLAALAAWQALRADRARDLAERERTVAERRFEDTRSLAKAMLFDVDDAIATGPTKARERLVMTALTYLDRLSNDRLTPDLERDVASGYERIANILGNSDGNNLGRPAEARAYLTKALAMRERIEHADPSDRDNLAGLVGIHHELGGLDRFGGAPASAAEHFATATRFAETRAALDPGDRNAALDVFARRRDEALIRYVPGRPNLNRYDDAMQRYRQLLADLDADIARHPGGDVPPALDPVLNDMTRLSRLGGDSRAALATSQRSLALAERRLEREPDNPVAVRSFFLSLRATGDSLMELGRADEGLALLRRSQAMRRAAYAADPSSALAARDVAIGAAMMGYAYEFSNHPREALAEYSEWASRAEAALAMQPDNKGHRLDLEQARWSIAGMQLALGRPAQALATARRVEEEVLAFAGPSPDDEAAREALGKARLIAARSLVASGHAGADAFDLAKSGVDSLAVNERKTPDDGFAARDAALGRVQAGEVGHVVADRAEACALVTAGRDGLQRLVDRDRLPVQFAPFLADAEAAAARCTRRK